MSLAPTNKIITVKRQATTHLRQFDPSDLLRNQQTLPGMLTNIIVSLARDRNIIYIGIDGPQAAGKTELSMDLTNILNRLPIISDVISINTDIFLIPRNGPNSRETLAKDPEQFKNARNYYDRDLGKKSFGRIRSLQLGKELELAGLYNRDAGGKANGKQLITIPHRGCVVIVFEGTWIFDLLPTEKAKDFFDYTVYIGCKRAESLRRQLARAASRHQTPETIKPLIENSWHPTHEQYLKERHPTDYDLIVNNTERSASVLDQLTRIPLF